MKNDYEVRGDVTAIFVNHKGSRVETLISTESLPDVKSATNNTWTIDGRGYVICSHTVSGKRVSLKLHRVITNPPNGLDVDHIDTNPLNNVKSNLRLLTRKENQQNRNGAYKCSSSGVRNVSWFQSRNKWRVTIVVDRKQKHIGYFENIEDAERAATESRKKYMPFSREAMKRGS